MVVTAISGGIGSGKSTVAQILRTMGLPVYDCDRRAHRLMDGSDEIKRAIAAQVCANAITPAGAIDRRQLAQAAFSDPRKLRRLNAIVHGAVRDDLRAWIARQRAERAWFETALLRESGLDALADDIWVVTAPVELRIRRVMARSGMTADQVQARIAAQASADTGFGRPASLLVNDGFTPLLPAVLRLVAAGR